MIRTTISLPEELMALVDQERRRHGISASEVIRRAVEAQFTTPPEPRPLRIASLGRSGRTDVAERAEEILAEEWGSSAFIDAHLGRAPRMSKQAESSLGTDKASSAGNGNERDRSRDGERKPSSTNPDPPIGRQRAGGR